MRILIVGGGKSGAYLAENLRVNHEVAVIEQRPKRAETLRRRMPDLDVFRGDGCEPAVLEAAGLREADLVAAVTGDDEDNLVIAMLSKSGADPRVFARVNHPRNEWLFTREWGVDAAVSSANILYDLVEKQFSLSDIVTLLRLETEGKAIEELTLPGTATAIGKSLAELDLPSCAQIMAILSEGGGVTVPRGETVLREGDQLLMLCDQGCRPGLMKALGMPETGEHAKHE